MLTYIHNKHIKGVSQMNRLEIIDNLVEENLGGSLKYITDSNGDSYLTEESQELYNTEFDEIENMFRRLEQIEIACENGKSFGTPDFLTPDEFEKFYINKVMPFDKRSMDEIIKEYMGAD
jgi:hypothetical protein